MAAHASNGTGLKLLVWNGVTGSADRYHCPRRQTFDFTRARRERMPSPSFHSKMSSVDFDVPMDPEMELLDDEDMER